MQRIVRAKRELRDAEVTFDIAPRELVQERLPRILNAIYLLFDAGYLSPRHPQWFRPLLCDDALRLVRMLADHPLTAEPETYALAALLHLTAARSPARVDAEGHPVPLAKQDRSRWDQAAINAGMEYFFTIHPWRVLDSLSHRSGHRDRARERDQYGNDRLGADRASLRSAVRVVPEPGCNFEPGHRVTLRAWRARGADGALRASDELHAVQDTLVYHATMAELHEALEEHDQAAAAFSAAADLAGE